MAKVIVVGDGPAGLSAALFLAKSDHEVVVYGKDETPMHFALLRNYLGVVDEPGDAFQERTRAQVTGFGARLVDAEVAEVGTDSSGFTITTEAGETDAGQYLILAGGKTAGALATSLGIQVTPIGVDSDRDGRTRVDRVYVVGRLAKPHRSQAIVSAGAGAAAALDILAREAGKDVTDWDTPEQA